MLIDDAVARQLRVQAVAAEWRAAELLECLKAAVAGAPHWRTEAQALLRLVDSGTLPDRAKR